MCDRESFAKIRDAIGELQKANVAQNEQLKTLFNITERHGKTIDKLTTLLVTAMISMMFLLLCAVIYGALGQNGFNAVTSAKPTIKTEARQ